jgi:hypothetical protein
MTNNTEKTGTWYCIQEHIAVVPTELQLLTTNVMACPNCGADVTQTLPLVDPAPTQAAPPPLGQALWNDPIDWQERLHNMIVNGGIAVLETFEPFEEDGTQFRRFRYTMDMQSTLRPWIEQKVVAAGMYGEVTLIGDRNKQRVRSRWNSRYEPTYTVETVAVQCVELFGTARVGDGTRWSLYGIEAVYADGESIEDRVKDLCSVTLDTTDTRPIAYSNAWDGPRPMPPDAEPAPIGSDNTDDDDDDDDEYDYDYDPDWG